jgi:hypothetical protein
MLERKRDNPNKHSNRGQFIEQPILVYLRPRASTGSISALDTYSNASLL